MKDKLSAFWNGFKEKWGKVAHGIKVLIITGIVVVIVASIILTLILNQNPYVEIYTGLSSEELTQVVSAINDLGISDVKVGNTSVAVLSSQVDDVRMRLSIQGYPSSTFNFDVWDNGIGMWSTDTEKKVKQLQQLQTHLMCAIESIKEISKSYVIITLPDNKNYVISNDKDEPRVSVKLDLKGGASLSSTQVEGIYNLVLNSLPGLKRENISIIGTDGSPLNGTSGLMSDNELYQSRLNFETQMEALLKGELDSTLRKLFKDYTINVHCELDYDSSKSELTIYTPSIAEDGTEGGMVSSSTKTEGWGGIGSLSGVVGTTGNSDISPNYPTITGDGDNEYYYQNSVTVNRLVNTEIKQLEKNGYEIKKITAAITVDQATMLEAQKEQLREVVAFAIGTDVLNVTVANYPFIINGSNGNGGNSISVSTSKDWIYLLIVCLGLFVIMLLIVAILAGNSKKKKRARIKAKAAAAAATAAGVSQQPTFTLETQPSPAESESFNIPKLGEDDGNESKSTILRREIKDFSHDNPDVVAQLLRTLMRDEKE